MAREIDRSLELEPYTGSTEFRRSWRETTLEHRRLRRATMLLWVSSGTVLFALSVVLAVRAMRIDFASRLAGIAILLVDAGLVAWGLALRWS